MICNVEPNGFHKKHEEWWFLLVHGSILSAQHVVIQKNT